MSPRDGAMPGGACTARHVAFPLLVAIALAAVSDAVTAAAGVVLAVAVGLAWRRWLADRSAAAAQIIRARAEQRRAAAEERARAARELHDIAALHITNLIVHIGATARRARPEDVRPALDFAADAARSALRAMDRFGEPDTVADLADSLHELASYARRLGQRVTVGIHGTQRDLPAPVAGSIRRIVGEALSNALRYATGAPVIVSLRYLPHGVSISVTNGSAECALSGGGSTRLGLASLREQVVRLGGRLRAGPQPRGGWSVRATLPTAQRRRLAGVDVLVAAAITGYPIATGIAAEGGTDTPPVLTHPASSAALIVFLLLRGIPLLWRRMAPAATLTAVLAVMGLWPVAVLAGLLPQASAWLAGLTAGADIAAVYAMGAYSHRRLAWLAPMVTAAGTTGALAVGVAFDGSVGGVTVTAEEVLGDTIGLFVPAAVLLYGVVAVGRIVRTRRYRVERREELALHLASEPAMAERARLARAVRAAVAGRTLRLVSVVDGVRSPDQLAEVRDAAGAVLHAMRQQLHRLRGGG